jgi:uncharacterized membrane protein YhhN
VTASAWLALVLAAGFAVGDWVAVVSRNKQLEYFCKPLVIVFLMAVAASVDVSDPSVRNWFLVALVCSLAGDVFLMLPRNLFVAGLAAFLLAHLAYIAGMWVDGVSALPFALGLAAVGLAFMIVGGRIRDAVKAGDNAAMATPVTAYMAVISLMVASAVGTEDGLAVLGAALFYCSDALIAWRRFVKPRSWHALTIMVTYHAAQAGLTLSLIS